MLKIRKMLKIKILFHVFFLVSHEASAFVGWAPSVVFSERKKQQQPAGLMMALGDFTVELGKPLGIILEECDEGGVYVKEMDKNGAAAKSKTIVPGDVLLKVEDNDVSKSDFDSVMELLIEAPPQFKLTVGDGLGTMDMPKNVVKTLQTTEDAYFVDAVVREAVRRIRRDGRLGNLVKVEVIIGAGVQNEGKRGLARFFAIFSTDGFTTYSCNVSATGIRQDDGSVRIVYLSCAKDEGLGQTYDLIREVV